MSDEKLYIKGFNRGYELQKFNPDLAQSLMDGLQGGKTSFWIGFGDGRDEYVKELNKSIDQETKVKQDFKSSDYHQNQRQEKSEDLELDF